MRSSQIQFHPMSFVFTCILCIVFGCSSNVPVADEGTKLSVDNLLQLYNAYVSYCNDNQAAPGSQSDLEPYFEPNRVPAVFSSERDNKPFKVYWGTSIELASRKNNVIIAHEQEGQNGVRYVVTCFGISEMTDKEFQDSDLPGGQQPGS